MWTNNDFKTYIFIFNVERGLSIFIRTGINLGIIYDCGSSSNFSPTAFIKQHLVKNLDSYQNKKIAQLILSHPHADHISEVSEFIEGKLLAPDLVTCPHDKPEGKDEVINWNLITNDNTELINTYRALYKERRLPLQTIHYNNTRFIPNLEYGLYYIKPPIVENNLHSAAQEYSNAISIVFYLKHGQNSILIPGDITPQAFKYILEQKPGTEKRYSILEANKTERNWPKQTDTQPSLYSRIKEGISVLVAPHHGLESAYSPEFYNICKDNKPHLVVISEKRHTGKNDGNIADEYQHDTGSQGTDVVIAGKEEPRYSISTKNNDHILIIFDGNPKFKTYLEKNPEDLLKYIK